MLTWDTYMSYCRFSQGRLSSEAVYLTPVQRVVSPTQEETIPQFIQAQLMAYIETRQERHKTSVLLLDDAEVIARYRLPMTFLYSLVGDTHAIVLCVARGGSPQSWKLPTYVSFDPHEITDFFERTLGDQCIRQTGRGG
jgi:hypothetical protein